jgi:predicted dinucleotide-binding enzyme
VAAIGVLGSGEVGRTLAAGLHRCGHDVMIGSREPGKLSDWLARDGRGIRAGTFDATAEFGELIVLAVLGNAGLEAIWEAGPQNFAGKIVIDAMNPLDLSAGMPPRLSITGYDSLGEQVQRAIPDAKVVKAFNTIGNPFFVDPKFSDGEPTMMIAGNDSEAKTAVSELVQSFGWPPAVDVGPIAASRELEALCILWVRIGNQRGAWDHGFKLLMG